MSKVSVCCNQCALRFQTLGNSFEKGYNRSVRWIADHSSPSVEAMRLKSSNSLLTKVAKIFSMIFGGAILIPLACMIFDGGKKIGEMIAHACCCCRKTAPNTPHSEPYSTSSLIFDPTQSTAVLISQEEETVIFTTNQSPPISPLDRPSSFFAPQAAEENSVDSAIAYFGKSPERGETEKDLHK